MQGQTPNPFARDRFPKPVIKERLVFHTRRRKRLHHQRITFSRFSKTCKKCGHRFGTKMSPIAVKEVTADSEIYPKVSKGTAHPKRRKSPTTEEKEVGGKGSMLIRAVVQGLQELRCRGVKPL